MDKENNLQNPFLKSHVVNQALENQQIINYNLIFREVVEKFNNPSLKQIIFNNLLTKKSSLANIAINNLQLHNTLFSVNESQFNKYNSLFIQLENVKQIINNPFLNKNNILFRNIDFEKLIFPYNTDSEVKNDVTNDLNNNINYDVDNFSSSFISHQPEIKRILSDIYINNEKLYKISPREFEKVIAELLYKMNFEVQLTKQTRDGGFDILALKHVDNLSPIKYLVECKRYSQKNKVGVEIIRSFRDVINTEQANKGLIVTTSYFSSDAIKKIKETPYLLDYKDKDEVINWVNNYCEELRLIKK